jgi:outer membrane protein OmpA-like peptidoglycan-associated protein
MNWGPYGKSSILQSKGVQIYAHSGDQVFPISFYSNALIRTLCFGGQDWTIRDPTRVSNGRINMKRKRTHWVVTFMFVALTFWIVGFLDSSAIGVFQPAASAQNNQPSYHVSMVPRTILAINYQNRTKTGIGFRGSPLMPLAKGDATVEGRNGRIAINADFRNLTPAVNFGPEYLTYVLWAITPEGKTNNLGELLLSGDKSKLQATTTLQTFGLIVTAEPYYAVSNPSDAVVLENVVLPGTSGTLQQVSVNYTLFGRGLYSYDVAAAGRSYPKAEAPLEFEEAMNAVLIAGKLGARQYAPDTMRDADQSLRNAEGMLAHGEKKVVVQDSRDAVQKAAEAIQMTIQRMEEETQAQERATAAQQTAEANAQAQAAAAQREQEAAARREAEQQKQQAEAQAQQDARARAQAEAQAQQDAAARAAADARAREEAQARAAAEAQSQQDSQAAARAQAAAAQAELEKQQLRAALLEQFNRILPTTDTPHGLKVNMADVLFAFGKADLQPAAREALAKFSGIVMAHPGLKMQVEGFTDSVGTDAFNQTLSENRANNVRAYLIAQSLDPSAITSIGYGKSNPVASNDTASGRQQNRRVEILISGEIIGTQIGSAKPAQSPGGHK